MRNSNLPAMPQSFAMTENECGTAYTHMQDEQMYTGLTKREYAAIKIMAGFASDTDTAGTVEEISKYAVKWADALLKELEKCD